MDTNNDRRGIPKRSTTDPNQQGQYSEVRCEPDAAARMFDEGRVVAHRAPGHIRERTLLAATVNPLGVQYEVGCELELGDGRHIPLAIDVETASALGQVLIAQAALSRKASNDEIDWHMARYARRTHDTEHTDDDIPY